MPGKGYKYTLLTEKSSSDIRKPARNIWKAFTFVALATTVFIYYSVVYSKYANLDSSTDINWTWYSELPSNATATLWEYSTAENETIAIQTTPTHQPSTSTDFETSSTASDPYTISPNTTTQTLYSANLTQPTAKMVVTQRPPPVKIPKLLKIEKFFVNTSQCHIPWVDPFTREIKKTFKPGKYKDCARDKAIIQSVFNETQRRYILSIAYENMEDISCCYQHIVRSGSGYKADNDFKLLPCANFAPNFAVPEHIDAVIVECKSKSTNKTIQKDAFSFVQERNRAADSQLNSKAENSFQKPNVLLIGIDSLSRINFRRNMPKTARYLKQNNWIEMKGYNKVGDNTFPNLMPLLVGFNQSISYSECKPKTVGGLNKCNFIWDDFKAHGYTTAYGEDETAMSSFNYLKRGFEKVPTDYYLRPLMMAIESKLKIVKKQGLKYCIGRRHAAEYVYDFGMEFGKRCQKTSPGFGLFWTNSFSHNAYDTSSTMDIKMVEYFERMKSEGILDTSIIIFFSDHGCRWGTLLKLPEGFLEERLPLFFLSLPEWFHRTYPDFAQALSINMNRLTTPFDIHQTLKHILNLNQEKNKSLTPAPSCPAAQSLFYEVFENRTCMDACIPEHWCTCKPYEVISTGSSEVKKVAALIVDEINNYLETNNFTVLCRPLTAHSIEGAHIKMETPGKVPSHNETLRIKFKTLPKDAEFQATAVYDLELDIVHVEIADISRLDSYAPHSKCIDNKLAKKFCICK